MGDNKAVSAGIYCRISLSRDGDTTKVEDQERISRELCEKRGWRVADVYADNNQSAWKRDRKRPEWDRMLADVGAGKISAIVVYHGDRLARQPYDLETLLNLAYGKGIKLASPTGTRDLSNEDDLFILRIEVAAQCRESAGTSRRKKAQFERWRREGRSRPGGPGGRVFGFHTDGFTHRPDEVTVIRQAAANVLAGESLRSVARQLAADGVVTTSGKPMTVQALRRILGYPRMAGLMPDGVSAASWEPVLERSAWEAMNALFAMNGALPNAGRGAQHLLSGIARCGADNCGRPLWSGYNGGSPAYKCHACGRVGRSMPLLDGFVTGAVLRRLNHSGNPGGRIPEAPGLAAEFAALTAARTEIDTILADHTRGSLTALLDRRDSVEKRLAELRELAGDDARARLRRQYAGMSREQFDAYPLAKRRALVAACFEVVVMPASGRGPGFRPEDVRLTEL